MYAKDTILALKEQRNPDPETGEEFPYNRVRVVGESPVSHSHTGNWEGGDAAGVLLAPLTNFGATLDEPFGKCRVLYDVAEMPSDEVEADTKIRVIDATSAQAGPTPEEVFKEQAPGVPPKEGERRARTSPLGETSNEAAAGPLGDAKPADPPAPPEPVNPSPLDEQPAPLPVAPDPAEDEEPPVAERTSPLDE